MNALHATLTITGEKKTFDQFPDGVVTDICNGFTVEYDHGEAVADKFLLIRYKGVQFAELRGCDLKLVTSRFSWPHLVRQLNQLKVISDGLPVTFFSRETGFPRIRELFFTVAGTKDKNRVLTYSAPISG